MEDLHVMWLSNSEFKKKKICESKSNIAYGVSEICLYLPHFSPYFVIIRYRRFTQTCGAVKRRTLLRRANESLSVLSTFFGFGLKLSIRKMHKCC